MKQTVFQYFEYNERKIEVKVDFIYNPVINPEIENLVNLKMGDQTENTYSIAKIVDQFTLNPEVQIRYIKLVPHEKQIL